MTNSTISNNKRGIRYLSGSSQILINTIIANNPGGDCSGGVTSLGYNLDSDGTCGLNATGDKSNVDPKLGPLEDNGGPTPTHALRPGSPAINHIPAEDCEVTTDQRGVPRPQGPRCDIGAFEFRVPADANGDGVVNTADLRAVAAAIGGQAVGADVNWDGVVDILDLALVALNLGRGGP